MLENEFAAAGMGLPSSASQLNVSTCCPMCRGALLVSVMQRLRLSKDVDECQPLAAGAATSTARTDAAGERLMLLPGGGGRGSHSSTFQLNLSRF
jgi:hypothetical protein